MNGVPPFPRITIEPGKMGGKPCIRGHRIPVVTILRCLADNLTRQQILEDYPQLEEADIAAALDYACALADDRVMALRPTGS